jgi:hypothetical protein
VTRKPWASWKFAYPAWVRVSPAAAGGEQEITHGQNEMRSGPWPEVAGHEVALMASEAQWGVPIPDIAEAADIAAWRAGYADLLSKGAEAVQEQIAASNAAFDRQAEAEPELEP